MAGYSACLTSFTSSIRFSLHAYNEWQTGIESNGALGLVLLTSGDPDIRTYAQQRIEKTRARVDILQDKFNRELNSEQGIKLLKTIGEKRQVYGKRQATAACCDY